MRRRNTGRGYLLVLLCVCIVAVTALTAVLMTTHAKHCCEIRHCPICIQILSAEKLQKLLILLAFSFALAAGRLAKRGAAFADGLSVLRFTPIALKTRMNN